MLSLREIVKTYVSGDTEVHALRGVSIDFRENEFVSILGPSGCGKTTLLNVIGGLDRYDSGDLVINGRSTKEFRDADWDTYRNHSIGFVFQSYNLISHQTVLANVELALTLSGVSREERRRRAIEALEQVGLGDQIHKKPNQMSGGQMQRVAIARALVNDPDILLADEPTGALDTATSVQIMDIIKQIAQRKLVIMVTHNPELAAEYSTRIIRLKDGTVIDDTDPYTEAEIAADMQAATAAAAVSAPEEMPCEAESQPQKQKKKSGKGKRSMSFLTALSLSLNNLLTKKTRTLLVSIAGSIGIIGIALILALSNGVNLFIANVQEETLTSYPISITAETSDLNAMLSAMVGTSEEEKKNRDPNKIYVDDSISNMVSAMVTM
ncbi:MAG: ABC transporter ATP-binding protein, partial [Clostridia bacterium]|nr:ABC transporter ATP-binding protein [Clostridia bacterium]